MFRQINWEPGEILTDEWNWKKGNLQFLLRKALSLFNWPNLLCKTKMDKKKVHLPTLKETMFFPENQQLEKEDESY